MNILNRIRILSVLFLLLLPLVCAAEPAGAPTAQQLADGKKQYMLVCVACHQPTGAGLPPVFPPLTKSEYVSGSAERLIAMVLKGNAGPMTIDGKLYNNIMPGQELMLKDEQIAAVLTYVRQNFGNNAPPITPDMVSSARSKFAERKAPWTEVELKGWKEETPAGLATSNRVAAPEVK